MNPKKVLVTGATGFLGRHLVHDLFQKGYEVTVLARKTSQLAPFEKIDIKVAYGDITDRLALLQACEDKAIVFHLAGYIAYKKAERPAMEKINVEGTANVIDACITNKVEKLLHLSSVVTIGANPKPEPMDENFEFNLSPFNLGYFETKRKAEKLIKKAVTENGLKAFMINPSTIYGAGDGTKGSRKTQIKVAKGQFKFYPPGGVNVVYVKDVIESIHLCLDKGQPGRRYIIGGENLKIKKLFETIAECAGVPAPSTPIPRWTLGALGQIGDILRLFGKETSLSSETAITASYFHWFDSSRAQRELGFQPTPAKTAILESISWMKENGLLEN